jgi:hypothetical protein
MLHLDRMEVKALLECQGKTGGIIMYSENQLIGLGLGKVSIKSV